MQVSCAKMKILVILLTFCLSCCLGKLSQHQMELISDFSKSCFEELNIPSDSDLLAKALKNKVKNYSDQQIDYFACMGQKIGAIDAEGLYRAQVIEDFFLKSGTFNRQDIIDVVEFCAGQQRKQQEGTKTSSYRDNVAFFNKCTVGETEPRFPHN